MQQQGLRSGGNLVIDGLLVPRGAQVRRLDFVALRCRQVGFWAGALVGRIGVGERAGFGLPDATLDPVQ